MMRSPMNPRVTIMAQRKTAAEWIQIDIDSLSNQQRFAYDEYKAKYRLTKEARENFENTMQLGVPDGMRIVLGYNFGKLSAAIVSDDRKPAKAKASTQSLAEFLAAQAAGGRRT